LALSLMFKTLLFKHTKHMRLSLPPNFSRTSSALTFLLTLALLCFCAEQSLHAQTFPNLGARDIRPPTTGDGATGDSFGARVAVCNGELLVAATGDQVPSATSSSGRSEGSVYRYQINANSLTPLGKISLPGIEQSALFGLSLACDSAELFIGAPGVGTINLESDAGTVFRYLRQSNGWLFNGEVPNARPAGDARFGYSMALNSGVLLIGAPGQSAAYLYRRNGISLTTPQKVQPSGVAFEAGFGLEVALGVGEFAVSAPNVQNAAVLRFGLTTPASEIARINGPSSFGTGLSYVGNQLWIGTPRALAGIGQVDVIDTINNVIAQTLTAPASGGPIEQFGDRISVSGQQVAVSATGARIDGIDGEGIVHIYARNASQLWTKTVSLRPSNVVSTPRADAFGNGICFDSSGVYVGAPYADAAGHPTQGRAYRFASTGAEIASIDSGRGAAFDRFGQALSISGNRALVGAYLVDSAVGVESGEAYVYVRERGGWRLEAKLSAPDAIEEQRFGVSVDIDGDLAVVGSYWDVVGTTVDAGSAYVFERFDGQWRFRQKLIAPQPRPRALFGFAVAVDGERIAVGARGDTVPSTDQGSVVFFQRDARGVFRAGATLSPPDPAPFDSFGAFIDLRADLAIVGAPGAVRADSVGGGRAYLMSAPPGSNDWSFMQTLSDPAGVQGDGFSFSVALGTEPLRAYVGTPFVAIAPNAAAVGRALEFRPDARGTWRLRRTLESPIVLPGTQFATSLAAHPLGVVVGAIGVDSGGLIDIGGGFFAPHDGPMQALIAPPSARAQTGRSVAVNANGTTLLGGPGVTTVNPQEGAVFEYLSEQLFGDGWE
jgi:hypothetical protein